MVRYLAPISPGALNAEEAQAGMRGCGGSVLQLRSGGSPGDGQTPYPGGTSQASGTLKPWPAPKC